LFFAGEDVRKFEDSSWFQQKKNSKNLEFGEQKYIEIKPPKKSRANHIVEGKIQ